MVGRLRSLCGGLQVHNHATSWPNLQDCKISSRAEIPKLDRVWQKSKMSDIRLYEVKKRDWTTVEMDCLATRN